MKKIPTILGLAGMLAGSPSAKAQINSTREKTNEEIAEVMAKEQKPLTDEATIFFEDAKVLTENQKLFEEIMNDERVQELIKKYGQKKMKNVVNLAISQETALELFENSQIEKAGMGPLAGVFLIFMLPILIEMASAAGNPDVTKAREEEKNKQRERDRKWAELFDDSEAKLFQRKLKENTKKFKNFIKIMQNTKKEEAEIMGFLGNKIHVELPQFGNFAGFKFDYFVSDLSSKVDENDIKSNPELEQRLCSKPEIGKFMGAINDYMKECGIDDLSSWISWGDSNSNIYIFLENMLNLNHLENYILQNKDKNHYVTRHPRLHSIDKESESFGLSKDGCSYRLLLKLSD